MSLWKSGLFVLALAVAACGGGDDGGGGNGPDAMTAPPPDSGGGVADAGVDQPDARLSLSLCEMYCSSVMSSCNGANVQYADTTDCVATCTDAGWREGAVDDTQGNSLYCRLNAAEAAATADTENNCASAGATGGGTCGSLCENYCFYFKSNNHCAAESPFVDGVDCVSSCNDLLAQDGDIGATDGNTVQCRLNYLVEAGAASDKTAACSAADIHGNDVCGSWCEVYCDLMETNCADQPKSYADRTECLTACAEFDDTGEPAEDPSESSGDTVQCRIDHAGIPAIRNPVDECDFAAAEPGDYCIEVVGPGPGF